MIRLSAFLGWLSARKWRVLLILLVALLAISPISDVYNRADNLITPIVAVVIMAVTLSTGLRPVAAAGMAALTVVWLIVGIVTDGSGLFAGVSIAAPLMFLLIVALVFVLLARWLAQVTVINAEVLCAAVCGYLILGIFWTDVYALVVAVDAHAIISLYKPKAEHADLIFFSYSTLTTSGFGDLIPRNPAARMWSVLEAVTGTFYNAIVIARFVSLYGFRPAPGPVESTRPS
jgi:hypothetical protein